MRIMRISDAERGAICLLNVTAELHQRLAPLCNTAEADWLSHGRPFPSSELTFKYTLLSAQSVIMYSKGHSVMSHRVAQSQPDLKGNST